MFLCVGVCVCVFESEFTVVSVKVILQGCVCGRSFSVFLWIQRVLLAMCLIYGRYSPSHKVEVRRCTINYVSLSPGRADASSGALRDPPPLPL